jgi:hypothetical protein
MRKRVRLGGGIGKAKFQVSGFKFQVGTSGLKSFAITPEVAALVTESADSNNLKLET